LAVQVELVVVQDPECAARLQGLMGVGDHPLLILVLKAVQGERDERFVELLVERQRFFDCAGSERTPGGRPGTSAAPVEASPG